MNSVLCKCLFLSILVTLSSSFNVDRSEQVEDGNVSPTEAISTEASKLEEESNLKEGLDTGKQADQPEDTSVDQSTNGESNYDGIHTEDSSNVNTGTQLNPGESSESTETKPEIPDESNDKDNTEDETPAKESNGDDIEGTSNVNTGPQVNPGENLDSTETKPAKADVANDKEVEDETPATVEDKPATEDIETTELPTEDDDATTDNGPIEDDVSSATDGPTEEETTSAATNEQTTESNTDDCEDTSEEDNTMTPQIPQEPCDQAKCEATCINYGYTAGGKGHCDSQGRCLCRSYVESCFFGNIDRCQNEKWWCPAPSSENKCIHEPEYSKYHMSCFCKGLQAETRQN